MDKVAAMYDVQVPAGLAANARSILEHWQEEAEAAAIREAGAPPDDVAAEPKPAPAKSERSVWPLLAIMAAAGAIALFFLRG
jgi:hypothetical protein